MSATKTAEIKEKIEDLRGEVAILLCEYDIDNVSQKVKQLEELFFDYLASKLSKKKYMSACQDHLESLNLIAHHILPINTKEAIELRSDLQGSIATVSGLMMDEPFVLVALSDDEIYEDKDNLIKMITLVSFHSELSYGDKLFKLNQEQAEQFVAAININFNVDSDSIVKGKLKTMTKSMNLDAKKIKSLIDGDEEMKQLFKKLKSIKEDYQHDIETVLGHKVKGITKALEKYNQEFLTIEKTKPKKTKRLKGSPKGIKHE